MMRRTGTGGELVDGTAYGGGNPDYLTYLVNPRSGHIKSVSEPVEDVYAVMLGFEFVSYIAYLLPRRHQRRKSRAGQ